MEVDEESHTLVTMHLCLMGQDIIPISHASLHGGFSGGIHNHTGGSLRTAIMTSHSDICRSQKNCDDCISSHCVWTESFWFPCRENQDESDSRVYLHCNMTTPVSPTTVSTTTPSAEAPENEMGEIIRLISNVVLILIIVVAIAAVIAILIKQFGLHTGFRKKQDDQEAIVLDDVAACSSELPRAT